MTKNRGSLLVFMIIALGVLFLGSVMAVDPDGAQVTPGVSSRANTTDAGNNSAIAGNVTELTIFGYSITQSWQGYFGNVSGTIKLADSSDNVMYNWSLASPQGEIYASTNSSITWSNIQCFNFTATGAIDSGSETAGATNLKGTNITQLETEFNISASAADGVDQTFTLLGSGHNEFYTANKQFTTGECRNTQVFDSTGQGQDDNFEEVLLYEPVTSSVIFTTILEQDTSGFDSNSHDFEMLVLENGHGDDTSTTPYYFFVELE